MVSLAIDLGGSRAKMALVSDGQAEELVIIPVNGKAPLADTLRTVASHARQLLSRAAVLPACAGLAFPGIVRNGEIISANGKYEDAVDFDWQAWARESLGLRLHIMNDAAAALAGEMAFGAGRGWGDAALLMIGTGIGTAAARDGRVLEGKHGAMGMLGGHIAIEMLKKRRCTCGNVGCLEAWAGTWALDGLARESELFSQSCLRFAPAVDYRALAEGMEQGDELSAQLLNGAALALGMGAVNLIHAYDPEVVILTGGPAHIPLLCEKIAAYAHRHAWTPWGKTRFCTAENPEASVLLGLHARCAEQN